MYRFRFFYALSPKSYKQWVEKHIDYCDFAIPATNLIGFLIMFGLLLGYGLALLPFVANAIPFEIFLILGFSIFVLFEAIAHLMLVIVADSRARFVEQILPDVLQIISANMRSGLTPDKAILTSARPEFGPLEVELKKVAKETLSGMPFEESLKQVTKKIKSKILDKTIKLLVEGLEKGGSITSLLDSIGDDIRQMKILGGEIRSYVMLYSIFIFFAVGIGAPLLYSVSTYSVEIMTRLGGQVDVEKLFVTSNVVPFKFKVGEVTAEFLRTYSMIAISITSIFGGMLIGLIQEGSEKAGIRFIPVLLFLGLGIYFVLQLVLSSVFAGISNI